MYWGSQERLVFIASLLEAGEAASKAGTSYWWEGNKGETH